MRAAPLLVTLAVLAAACGGGEAPEGRSTYVQANEELLESLPVYPGAREVERSFAAYSRGGDVYAVDEGYTTLVLYELPRRVAQRDVIDFYVGALDGWKPTVEYAPGVDVMTGKERPGAWAATLTRGEAAVGVNTDNLIAGRRFEVSVDHAGATSRD